MPGNGHVRFGGRAEETDRWKRRHRASVRPYTWRVFAPREDSEGGQPGGRCAGGCGCSSARHRLLRHGPHPVGRGAGPPRRNRPETNRPARRAATPTVRTGRGGWSSPATSTRPSVYSSAGRKASGLVNLYCWAHVRRHFVRAGDANPDQLSGWTAAWLERIKNLYTAHEQLRPPGPTASPAAPLAGAAGLEQACTAWDDALGVIDAARTKQMAAPGLQEPAKKALATLDREWDGLAAHRDYPMISLDNNAAERALRRPVVTRKNAYGSRTEDAARLAARIWTITATAEMAGLNPITYLTAYLDACGRTGGKPPTGPDLERFLPWTATPDDLHAWAQPPRPG